MSDDLNTEIKIGADASGVEAGVGKAKRSLKSLGDAAQQAGKDAGAGMGAIGAGGDKSAKDVERATRTMQNSIQRLIAEQKAGAKGSREYWEALANTRGVNTADLRPLLDQLDEAKRKTDEAKNAADDLRASLGKINGAVVGSAIAAAAVGISALVKNTIDSADAFSKLSAKSGVAVDSLRELNYAASLSDVSTDSLGNGLRKLSQNMAAAAGGSKLQADAFKAAGVEIRNLDGSLKGADEMLKELASRFAGFKDGPEKAALAMELFGKQGADLIPLLNGGAAGLAEMAKEANDLGIVFDGDLAKSAEEFNDNLTRIQTSAEGAAVAITRELLPTLNNLAQAFVDSQNNSQSFATWLGGGLRTVVEAATILISDVKFVLEGLGREIGAIGAQFAALARGDFSGWTAISDAVKEDGVRAKKELDKFQFDLLNARFLTSKAGAGRGTAPDPRALGVGEGTVAPIVNKLAESAAKSAKAALSEYDKLIQNLSQDLPKAAAEAEAAQNGYNKSQTEFVALANSPAWAKFTNDQRATVAALFEQKINSEAAADAAKTLAKANLDAAASREKYITSLSTGLDKIQADIAAQIEATERMGLSKEAIAELDAAKLEMLATDLELQAIKAMDRNLDQQTYDALKKQAAAYRELGIAKKGGAAKEAAIDLEKANAEAAKKAQEDWERAAEQINSTLTDALMRGFESGKDFAKNLRDTVVNMFKTMILRPVISAVLSPVSMALSGLTGAGSAAAGQAGGSALGSAGGSLMGSALGGIGAFGTGASYGATSLFANGLTGTLAAGGQMIGAGSVMSGLGTIAGALGPIALGIGLLSSLIKKSTPHMGAASSYSEAGGLVSNADIYQNVGFRDARTYNAEAASVTGGVARAIGDTLNSTAKAFGKTAGYEITTAFADDSSKDGAWGSLIIKQMGEAVLDWRDTQTSEWAPKEFADGEAGQKEYLSAIAKSTRDALDAIDLPGWADDMLATLGDSPSLEGLAQTVDQINAAQAAFESLGKNIVGFGALTDGAISQLVKAAGGIEGLVSAASTYYDNFYSEAEKTANVTRDITAALADVGLAMPKTRDEFRALVESQMALGDAGTDAVAALLGVSGAFASVTAASETAADAAARLADEQAKAAARAAEEAARRAEEVARERYGLETQLMQLLGDTAGLRKREIEALDASNRALQEHIYAIEDARAAYEKSITAAQSAYSVLESSVGRERSVLQSALDAEREAINARYKLQQDGHAAQISAAQSAADKMRGIASMLSGALGRMVVESPALDRARLQSARGVIGAAAASSNVMAPGLEAALSVVTDDVRKLYGKWEDFAFDQGVTAGQTAALSSAAQSQLSGYESIVNALKAQDDVTKLLADAELAAAQERFEIESKKLDAQLEQGKSMLDRLLGIEEGTLSSVEALARLTDAVNAGNAALQAQRAAEAAARMAVMQGGGGGGGGGVTQGAAVGNKYTDADLLAMGFNPSDLLAYTKLSQQSGVQDGLDSIVDNILRQGDDALRSAYGLQYLPTRTGPNGEVYTTLTDKYGKTYDNGSDWTNMFTDAQRAAASEAWTNSAAINGITPQELETILQIGSTADRQLYSAGGSLDMGGFSGNDGQHYSSAGIVNAINTVLAQGASVSDVLHAGQANFGLDEEDIRTAARAAGIPGFATGINRVPHDMLARIHKDEAVVPAAYNPYNPGAHAPGNAEVVAELRKLNERIARIEASSNATAGHTAGTDRKLARVIRNDAMITEALPA